MDLSVHVHRGSLVESRHAIHAVWSDSAGQCVRAWGRSDDFVFLRSAAKPFQAAAVIASGAADRFGFDQPEIAIVSGSHSGEDVHAAAVLRLLEKLGLGEDSLRCGVHPPLDVETAERLGKRALTPLRHNCSGKHAGMLALGLHLGEPPERYLAPDGAGQRLIRQVLAAAAGIEAETLAVAVDGCSAPVFALPLRAGARAFALLGRPETSPPELREAIARVVRAMTAHPELVAGTGRFDTRLMAASGGRLISKAGAEGVQGVADVEHGLGLLLKVEDGTSRAVAPATLAAIDAAGVLDRATAEAMADLRAPVITNHAGLEVGRIEVMAVR